MSGDRQQYRTALVRGCVDGSEKMAGQRLNRNVLSALSDGNIYDGSRERAGWTSQRDPSIRFLTLEHRDFGCLH